MRRAIADTAYGIGAAVDLVVTCKSPIRDFCTAIAKGLGSPDNGAPQSQLPGSIPHNMKGGSISPFRRRRRVGPSPTVPGADVMVKEEGAASFAEPERRSGLLRS